jgi:type II secretory pathway component PulK
MARIRPDVTARRFSVTVLLLAVVLLLLMRPDARPVVQTAPLRMNANTAPRALLLALPQMGPARVAAILAARAKAPFHSAEDMARRVRGIGPATQELLRPYLLFDHEPASTKSTE